MIRMIHYKFEGSSEIREANIQFSADNDIIGDRILKNIFKDLTPPCKLQFIKEEDGIYIFKRIYNEIHVYKESKPVVIKKKRRWTESRWTENKRRWNKPRPVHYYRKQWRPTKHKRRWTENKK